MTLRITTRRDIEGGVLMIDGRLDAEGVSELQRVAAGAPGPLRVELAGLRSADEAGLEALRTLRARGIVLTGASPYFRLLLGAEKRRKDRAPPSPPGSRRADRGGRRGRPQRSNDP